MLAYKERCRRKLNPEIGFSVEYIYAGTVHARVYVNGDCQRIIISFPISKFIEKDRFKIRAGSLFVKIGKQFHLYVDDEPVYKYRRRLDEAKRWAKYISESVIWE